MVARLKAAGAVIVGKTNVPEFGAAMEDLTTRMTAAATISSMPTRYRLP